MATNEMVTIDQLTEILNVLPGNTYALVNENGVTKKIKLESLINKTLNDVQILEIEGIETKDKTLKGILTELSTQYKGIANLSLVKHTDGKVYIKKQDGTLLGTGIEISGSNADLSKITMSMDGQTLKLMNDGTQIATVEIPTAVVTDEQLTSIIQSKIDDGSLGALSLGYQTISEEQLGFSVNNEKVLLTNLFQNNYSQIENSGLL